MTDYQKYINALRKCAKEHEGDSKFTGHIIVSDLCRDTANLLEALEQEPTSKSEALVSLDVYKQVAWERDMAIQQLHELGYEFGQKIEPKTGHWIKSRDCYGNNHFTCSFCGHDIATKADIWDDNYCSNCGCRMIEPQEVREHEKPIRD